MSKLRDRQLLFTHCKNLINDGEFILLCDLKTPRSLNKECWLYPMLDLEAVNDDDVISKFKFYKHDVYWVKNPLGFPDGITGYFYTMIWEQNQHELYTSS